MGRYIHHLSPHHITSLNLIGSPRRSSRSPSTTNTRRNSTRSEYVLGLYLHAKPYRCVPMNLFLSSFIVWRACHKTWHDCYDAVFEEWLHSVIDMRLPLPLSLLSTCSSSLCSLFVLQLSSHLPTQRITRVNHIAPSLTFLSIIPSHRIFWSDSQCTRRSENQLNGHRHWKRSHRWSHTGTMHMILRYMM